VTPLRQADFGFSVMMVSNMDRGAGSVAVSARPAFPNTDATSGKARSAASCFCSSPLASSIEIPGTVMGMKRIDPSSRGGMNSEPSRRHGKAVATSRAAITRTDASRCRSRKRTSGR
jgi:hypothetical protein